MFSWSIRTKFTAVLLLFAVTSILFVGYAYAVAQGAFQKRIGSEIQRQASGMMSQLDRMLYDRYRNIQSWSNHEILLDALTEDKSDRISEFLTTAKEEYGLYSDLLYADNSGKIIAASNNKLIGKNVFDEGWFKKVVQTKEIQTEGLQYSKMLGGHVITFAIPAITDELLKKSKILSAQGYENRSVMETLEAWKPDVLGVLAAFINWNEVIEEINMTPVLDQNEQDENAYAILIDSSGQVLTQPFFESDAVMFHQNLHNLNINAAKVVHEGESGYSIEKGRYDRKDFIGYAPSLGVESFAGFGWAVLIFQSESYALAPIRPLLFQIFGIGFALVILTLIVSIRLSTGMTRPLVKLLDLTKAVAKGDFSATVEVKSKDEVGKLAEAFNDMTKTLDVTKVELGHANEYADSIIRSTVDAMFVTDKEGKIQRCNPAVTTLLKFSEEDLQDRPIQGLVDGVQTPENDIIKGVRIHGVFSSEMEYRTKDGETIPMLVSATPMKNAEGEDEGIVVIAKDITDFKSLEQQFQRAQRMDAVGRLAGGIAHDFNNMLTIILGYSEKMLRKMGKEDPRGGEVGQVLKAGKRAAGLVRQLLTFSRRQIVKAVNVDLNDLLMNMHKMLKHMTGENIEVVALPSEKIWPVKIDPGQFEQVIANLVVNARDAMPKGGKIVLKTENFNVSNTYAKEKPGMRVGDYVVLSCQDTGTGMPEEVKKQIFEPFFTTKGKDKGTGLGLATCYGMVKQAGGYIDVESVVGEGTTFRIFLPRGEGEVHTMTEEIGTIELPKGNETILLVEDEELVRELAVSVLKELGYNIIAASNGSEALLMNEENKEKQIDLLLTDVVMPKMGGRELAERYAKLRPESKILFMSGYADDDSLHKSATQQKIELIQKPITPTGLAVKVRQTLDGVKAKEEEAA